MKAQKQERVVKGWYVEAILDNDPPNPLTGVHTARMVSRPYSSRQTANDFADLLRKSIRAKDSVNVRTKVGLDKIDQDSPLAA